jgi:hypothetical protein
MVGKGNGLVILLHGFYAHHLIVSFSQILAPLSRPSTGKTLTAGECHSKKADVVRVDADGLELKKGLKVPCSGYTRRHTYTECGQ